MSRTDWVFIAVIAAHRLGADAVGPGTTRTLLAEARRG